ncbi:MAG TPA: S8 family serine peptidase, partial [Candidatus Krumholzibacteria bacterium]|nr:S8 family serine peptidase [Candidatus Krumholzibacteria bacterium]
MNGRFLLVMLGLALGAGSVRAGDSRPVWVFFDEAAVAAGFVATADDPAVGLDPPVVAATTRADGLRAAALAAAATTGAHLRHVSRWLDAASFDATPAQERALAALPGVGHVQPVARGQRPEPVPTRPLAALPVPDKAAATDLDYGYNLPGMLQVNVPLVHALGLRGRGVVVGVMDGGFDTGHEAFQGLVVLGAWDFVNGDPVVADEPGDPMGADAHGTMVLSALAARKAGHLMGPAPDVAVLLAKTEDAADEQPIEEDHWLAGLEWLEANGADVVTSSLIYYDWYDFADLDGHTAVTTRAAAAAAARGVLILNAAGNNRTTTGTLGAPADADSIITVGAVSTGGSTTWFSSPGPTADGRIKPDVAAQGLNNPVADPVDPFAYLEASGTSFATPLVAGVAALVLERAPGLTNLQVRDALRETASHPGAPDNDQGWGVIDALAAVRYWGPVFAHLPVPDTEDPGGPFGVGAMATAVHGLDEASLVVRWRAAGGAWQTVPLVPTGGGPVAYFAEIPGQPSGTVVDYYLEGTDLAGVTVTEPVRAPTRLHTFRVGPDTTPPVISHVPLGNQALSHWPPTVRCTATDNLGVMSVMLYWSLNGGPVQGPVGLLPMGGDDAWVLQPNWGAGVAAGDHVAYWLTATDRAAAANTTTTAQYDIQVLAVADDDTVLTDSPGQFIPDGTASGLVRVLFLDAPATP